MQCTPTTFCYVHTSTLNWDTPRSHRGHPRIYYLLLRKSFQKLRCALRELDIFGLLASVVR